MPTGPPASLEPPVPAMDLYALDERVFLQQTPGTGVDQTVSFMSF